MDALNVENFSFVYAGQSDPAISGACMRVEEGAFAVLCGRTGAGKSTLLRCVKRSVAPAGKRSGSVRVFGSEVSDALDVPDAGFVFQDPESQIVCDTVWRELAFGLENSGVPEGEMRRRVAEVATVFGMGGWFDAKTAELSGGQKQMLNLASVIAMRPRLLLLDEPTAQLDPVSAQRLCDALRRIRREFGVTVVVATHSPERFADMASAAFVMEGGSVRECGVESLAVRQKGEPRYRVPSHVSSGGGASGHSSHGDVSGGRCVSVKDAWFSYAREGKWVLRGLDLDVRKGEVVSLVGANGCGKSTLLKLIAGVLKPQRGKAANHLRGSQAYMPQDPRQLFLFDTVQEELADAFSRGGVGGPAGWLSGWLSCEGMLGQDSALRQRNPLDLSGGQQQKLALAKLLVLRPDMLLLDEPSKGLDAESQVELALILERLSREGVTVVLSTHDLSFASRASDRMALLFDGQVACVADPRGFCEGNAYYRPVPNRFTAAWDALGRESAGAGETAGSGAGESSGEDACEDESESPGAGAYEDEAEGERSGCAPSEGPADG